MLQSTYLLRRRCWPCAPPGASPCPAAWLVAICSSLEIELANLEGSISAATAGNCSTGHFDAWWEGGWRCGQGVTRRGAECPVGRDAGGRISRKAASGTPEQAAALPGGHYIRTCPWTFRSAARALVASTPHPSTALHPHPPPRPLRCQRRHRTRSISDRSLPIPVPTCDTSPCLQHAQCHRPELGEVPEELRRR